MNITSHDMMGGRMFGLGVGEILLVGVVGLLLFGPKKLPELGSSMGKAITNFKKGLSGTDHDDESNSPSTSPRIEQSEHKQ